MKDGFRIGLDVGGTKILALLMNDRGDVIEEVRRSTVAEEGMEKVLGRIVDIVDELSSLIPPGAGGGLRGIGIGFPGLVDCGRGFVYSSVMLPGWEAVPLAQILGERVPLPADGCIAVDNDVNAATIAEWRLVSPEKPDPFVMLTLGTGIGGGIIVNGGILRGPDGTAGEFGNMTVRYDGPSCECGNRGCLNVFSSGKAMARRSMNVPAPGNAPKDDDLPLFSLESTRSEEEDALTRRVLDAAERGNPPASKIVAEAIECLGYGLVNIVNIFNPETIVLGGGLSRIGEPLLEGVKEIVRSHAFQVPARRVTIRFSALGARAGALGACLLAGGVNDGLDIGWSGAG